jgi:hypothetical protein
VPAARAHASIRSCFPFDKSNVRRASNHEWRRSRVCLDGKS